MNTARRSRNPTTWEHNARAGGFALAVRGRPVPVPEGRRRRLAGGKSAADAAPGSGDEWLRAPAGHRRNGPGCRTIAVGPTCPPRRTAPKASPMPRWGRSRWPRQPGAAPAGAGLPPANFRRCPSGTRSQASATFLRWPDGCQRSGRNPRAPRGYHRGTHGQPGPLPTRHLPFLCPKFPCPTRPCSRAVPSRAANQIPPVSPRQQRVRRARVAGHSHRAIPCSRTVTGDRSRSPSVAASPPCVHRVAVVLLAISTA